MLETRRMNTCPLLCSMLSGSFVRLDSGLCCPGCRSPIVYVGAVDGERCKLGDCEATWPMKLFCLSASASMMSISGAGALIDAVGESDRVPLGRCRPCKRTGMGRATGGLTIGIDQGGALEHS